MNLKKTFLGIGLLVLGAVIVFIAILWLHSLYLNRNYFVIQGAYDVDKVVDIAVLKSDPRQCDKINVQLLSLGLPREEYISECYFKVACVLNDAKICNFIIGSNSRNSCNEDVSNFPDAISMCENIIEERKMPHNIEERQKKPYNK